MTRAKTAILGFLVTDLGIFLTTCVFLPRRGSWGSSGPLSYFINSRQRWDIAWGVLVASLVLSVGVFFLLKSLGAFDERQTTGREDIEL